MFVLLTVKSHVCGYLLMAENKSLVVSIEPTWYVQKNQ